MPAKLHFTAPPWWDAVYPLLLLAPTGLAVGWQFQQPYPLPAVVLTWFGCELGSAAPANPSPWQLEQVAAASGWYHPSPLAVAVPVVGVLTR